MDFREVPGHGQGPQPGLEVTGAPEGGKRAIENAKRWRMRMSVKNLLTALEISYDYEMYMFAYVIFENLRRNGRPSRDFLALTCIPETSSICTSYIMFFMFCLLLLFYRGSLLMLFSIFILFKTSFVIDYLVEKKSLLMSFIYVTEGCLYICFW